MSLLSLLLQCMYSAGTKAVKTATVQTEVIDGFQILRSKDCTSTMQSLVAWTKALKRKYDHLTVSCHAAALIRLPVDREHAIHAWRLSLK